jgi:leader peptidase (prepilin peptidase) / N-methyltransferase
VRALLFALSGLLAGSFLTVVVSRLPAGKGVVKGRSRCPNCGALVRTRDNIPVISWVLLRGKCRDCGHPISPQYPLTELATALLFVAAGATFTELYLAIPAAAFLAIMLAIALIDARHRIVPNKIVYPSLILYGAAIVLGDLLTSEVDALNGLIGMLAYAVPLLIIAFAIPGGMGMGDVKLVALIGLVLGSLGLDHVAVAAMVGIISGGLGGVVALALGVGRKRQIPFGPYLAFGAAIGLLLGPQIANAYLRLTGLS